MLNRGDPGGLVTGSYDPLAGGKKQSTGGKINPQAANQYMKKYNISAVKSVA